MVVALSGPPRLGTDPGCEAHHHHAQNAGRAPGACPPASRPPSAPRTSSSSSAVPSPEPPSSRATKFGRKYPASTASRLLRKKSSLWSHFSRATSTERTRPLERLETSTAPAARSTRASRRPWPRRPRHLGSPCASSLSSGGMPSQKRICGADSCRGAWLRVARGGGVSRGSDAVVSAARPRVGGCLTAPMQRCSESAFVAGHGWRRCVICAFMASWGLAPGTILRTVSDAGRRFPSIFERQAG